MFSLERWQVAVTESFGQFAEQLAIYLPQLLSGVAILLVGWLLANVLSRLARRLSQGVDFIFNRIVRVDTAGGEQLKNSYIRIVERIVFWVTILFFIAVSANVLGWTLFSRWMDSVVAYIPGLLTGILIMMAGFLLGGLTRSAIMTASLRAGIEQSSLMARSAQIIVIFSSIIIGVEQIGLNVDFLSTLIVVIAGTILAGASLAFSLGSKTLIANLLGAQSARKHCRQGEVITIGDTTGEILEVTQQSIVLDTGHGRAVVPAKLFNELVSSHQSSTHAEVEEKDK